MRCRACDVVLNEREVTKKDKGTGEYFDMCSDCYASYKEALGELVDDSGIDYIYNLDGIIT